ncbi:MAG: TlpA disulfide reductase family protein [Spirochaetia bacterium]
MINFKPFYVLFILMLLFGSVTLLSAQEEEEIENLSEAQETLYREGFGVPKTPQEAPDFTLEDLSGNSVTLSELKGKVVLLNLWATWCPPCKEEMPSMEELYGELPRSEFTILAVAAPNAPRESLEQIESLIEDEGYTFPVLLDEDMEVNQTYGTGSIPTSWIIDPEGMLIARLVGAVDWKKESIVSALSQLSE